VDPKLLRQHARDCGRLAEERVDLFAKEALRELALEFPRSAEVIEADLRRKRRPKPRSGGRTLSRRVLPRSAHPLAQTPRRRGHG
jgi:hypothetical protein